MLLLYIAVGAYLLGGGLILAVAGMGKQVKPLQTLPCPTPEHPGRISASAQIRAAAGEDRAIRSVISPAAGSDKSIQF